MPLGFILLSGFAVGALVLITRAVWPMKAREVHIRWFGKVEAQAQPIVLEETTRV